MRINSQGLGFSSSLQFGPQKSVASLNGTNKGYNQSSLLSSKRIRQQLQNSQIQRDKSSEGTRTAEDGKSLKKAYEAYANNHVIQVKSESLNEMFSGNYAKQLRTQRAGNKDKTLQLKKLDYNFKSISSKIIRSKTSTAAKNVAGQAKREIARLKRERQNKDTDSQELEAAIAHVKAMERIALKKAKHLQEEEMAKRSGGPCAGSEYDDKIDESDKSRLNEYSGQEGNSGDIESLIADDEYIETAEELSSNEMSIDEMSMDEMMDDSIYSQMQDLMADMMLELADTMKETLEEMELEELSDELLASKGDMDPADLKEMIIRHRNKEMKDIVKADSEYLKVIFDHLSKLKSGAAQIPQANTVPQQNIMAMPSFSFGDVPQGVMGAGVDISV